MTTRLEITCIVPDEADDDRRIATLGGSSGRQSGGRWKLTLDDAIDGIEAGRWAFWTNRGGRPANVVVATRNGRKYLKTEADGVEPDSLLRLPRCS
ncbi:MAG: DUF3892 domain-containing protein [Alphaproteobacteria bacterium]